MKTRIRKRRQFLEALAAQDPPCRKCVHEVWCATDRIACIQFFGWCEGNEVDLKHDGLYCKPTRTIYKELYGAEEAQP